MPDEDINYKSELSEITITSIRESVQSKLQDQKTGYNSILEAFSVSDCLHATAIRSMINKEMLVVDTLVEFYTQLLEMMEGTRNDIEKTEDVFGVPHLTN